MNVLVTGFGPFLSHGENPSAILAAGSGRPNDTIEVSYRAADEFIENLDPASFDAWLMIGLAAKAEKMRLETVARNRIGTTPDVRGEVHGPGPISPQKPPQLAANLWTGVALVAEDEAFELSVDAGDYLCNYLLFRAIERFPDKKLGFLHVPPFEQMSLPTAQAALERILAEVERA